MNTRKRARRTNQVGVVVLVLLTDTGKVADNLDAELAEQVAVANTRALKDLRAAEITRAEDDHLAGLDLE